jgi:hypothetical protein
MTLVEEYSYTDIADQEHSVVLQKDGHGHWEVYCFQGEDCLWSMMGIPGAGHLYTEEEARKEFERWRPSA